METVKPIVSARGHNNRYQLIVDGVPTGPWHTGRKALNAFAKKEGYTFTKPQKAPAKKPAQGGFGEYRKLQDALRPFKEKGATTIALNSSMEELKAELERLKK